MGLRSLAEILSLTKAAIASGLMCRCGFRFRRLAGTCADLGICSRQTELAVLRCD